MGNTADLLLDVALEFGTTLDLEKLLPIVLKRVTKMLGAERALFALFDADRLLERAVVHNLEWEGPGHPLPVSKGLIDRVMEKDEIILIADAKSHSTFKDRGSVQSLGVRFMVGVPVHIGESVSGVICVDSRSGSGDPTPQDVRLLTALSRLVGTAVEKALLFEHQQLRAALLSQLVNELKTPLAVMTSNAGHLAKICGHSNPEVQEMANDVAASAEQISQLFENTIELSRIDAGGTNPEVSRFDVQVGIPHHLRSLEVVARPLDLRLEPVIPPDLPQVHTIPQWVWIVLDTLLFNALKHSHRGTAIGVTASARDTRGPREALERPLNQKTNLFRHMSNLIPEDGAPYIEITVEYQGPPISDELVRSIFGPDHFVSSRADMDEGFGLTIVDQCIRCLGGSVWIEEWREGAIAFSFTLPTLVEGSPM